MKVNLEVAGGLVSSRSSPAISVIRGSRGETSDEVLYREVRVTWLRGSLARGVKIVVKEFAHFPIPLYFQVCDYDVSLPL